MSSNHLRCVIISIGIFFLFVCTIIFLSLIFRPKSSSTVNFFTSTSTSTAAPKDENFNLTCPRPKSFSSNYDFDFTKHPHESQNLHGQIDYFRLTLSWSPTYCANDSLKIHFQCQHSFGFVVHGLWPSSRTGSHQRNCRNEPMVSLDLIRKYFCLMPSEYLMQSEREKHGTCFWNRPEDYFQRIHQLNSNIQIPKNIHQILNDTALTKKTREQQLRQSFLHENPQIPSNSIDIIIKNHGKSLKEVAFCFDLNFVSTHC